MAPEPDSPVIYTRKQEREEREKREQTTSPNGRGQERQELSQPPKVRYGLLEDTWAMHARERLYKRKDNKALWNEMPQSAENLSSKAGQTKEQEEKRPESGLSRAVTLNEPRTSPRAQARAYLRDSENTKKQANRQPHCCPGLLRENLQKTDAKQP